MDLNYVIVCLFIGAVYLTALYQAYKAYLAWLILRQGIRVTGTIVRIVRSELPRKYGGFYFLPVVRVRTIEGIEIETEIDSGKTWHTKEEGEKHLQESVKMLYTTIRGKTRIAQDSKNEIIVPLVVSLVVFALGLTWQIVLLPLASN